MDHTCMCIVMSWNKATNKGNARGPTRLVEMLDTWTGAPLQCGTRRRGHWDVSRICTAGPSRVVRSKGGNVVVMSAGMCRTTTRGGYERTATVFVSPTSPRSARFGFYLAGSGAFTRLPRLLFSVHVPFVPRAVRCAHRRRHGHRDIRAYVH